METGISPVEIWSRTVVSTANLLNDCHVSGSPVYVLEPKLQKSGVKIPNGTHAVNAVLIWGSLGPIRHWLHLFWIWWRNRLLRNFMLYLMTCSRLYILIMTWNQTHGVSWSQVLTVILKWCWMMRTTRTSLMNGLLPTNASFEIICASEMQYNIRGSDYIPDMKTLHRLSRGRMCRMQHKCRHKFDFKQQCQSVNSRSEIWEQQSSYQWLKQCESHYSMSGTHSNSSTWRRSPTSSGGWKCYTRCITDSRTEHSKKSKYKDMINSYTVYSWWKRGKQVEGQW